MYINIITTFALKEPLAKKNNKERFNTTLLAAISTDTAKYIIKEINCWVDKHSNGWIDYCNWYVGITNHPPTRRSAHKQNNSSDPHAWKDWNAKSRRISEAVETYFHDLGMKDYDTKGGAIESSKWIYVYKKHPTLLD